MKRLLIIFILLPSLSFAAFPTGWGRKCEIAIQSSKVDETLTNYPLLLTSVNLPSEMFDADLVKADGGDIRFSSDASGSTQLAAQVVNYDTTGTNEAEIWVKVPSVSSSVNTSIWVWYDSSAASLLVATDTYGSENVWGSEYKAVMHMDETPTASTSDVFFDATANGNDFTEGSTAAITVGDRVSGKIGYAIDHDNTPTFLIGPDIDITGVITLQVWISPKALVYGTADFAHIISKWQSYVSRSRDSADASPGAMMTTWDASTDYDAFGSDNWHGNNVPKWNVGVYDGSKVYSYVDGVKIDSTAHTGDIDLNNNTVRIGNYQDAGTGGYPFDGYIDEVRIIQAARSPLWISSEYNNHNAPTTFAIEGTPSDVVSAATGKVIMIMETD